MADTKWTIKGREFVNCNCSYGCPCQFNGLPTHGHCQAVGGFEIEQGHHGSTKLDGLKFVGIFRWPGAIHEGKGEAAVVIDERATEPQRAALLRILTGQDTEPGKTIFNVFASTFEKLHDPIFAPIEFQVDVAGRKARLVVPGVTEGRGEPILIGRQAARQGTPLAASAYFAAGYLLSWIGFALVATSAQWALERAALLTPMMAGASDMFSGAVLVAAGFYQWTPLKDACLRQCQAPWLFIQRHGGFRSDASGALALGARHGAYCIGCCWALMALLFVGGVMNVLWIAAIAILVLAEKVIPSGRVTSRTDGAGLFAGGAWLLAQTLR